MMKTIFKLAGVMSVLAISPGALAQTGGSDTDTKTVSISGNVAPLCILGTPSATSVDLGQLINTSGARVGKLTVIGNRVITLPGSFCNYANSVLRVDATALIAADASTPQPGFARAVNFTATGSGWATTNPAATTAASATGATPTATGSGSNQPVPKLADVALTLSSFSVPSDLLLVAGGYSGQVVVTLGPSVLN